MDSTVTLSSLLSQVRSYSGIVEDSRQARPGCIYVAIRGTQSDGHNFIPEAVRAGAAAVVGDRDGVDTGAVPYVRSADAREALAVLATAFYDNPSRDMLMVGVTGTCGKTTSTYLIESILAAAGQKVGVIGTVEVRYPGLSQTATHTTPGSLALQELLARMRLAGCTAVVMEVSSHALKLKRAHGVLFDVMVFTNLSIEHLDLHPDMEDYFLTKTLLFTEYADRAREAGKAPVAAVNLGDAAGRRLRSMLMERALRPEPLLGFHVRGPGDVTGEALTFGPDGIHGQVGDIAVASQLVGRFNGENLLGAITVARALGIPPEAISEGLRTMRPVPGRMERVEQHRGPRVFVDYAHKPGGLEVVLQTLREIRGPGRVLVVFGCGGDRDREKRPVMGEIAARLADDAWVTSDSPRGEDPDAILQDILVGMPDRARVHIEPDRRRAIDEAIQTASADDLVVIAGKGHEKYQLFGSASAPGGVRRVPFDDREVAAQALSRWGENRR